MGGCKTFFEQQAHRITLDAYCRLYADQYMTKLCAEYKDVRAITLMLSGCRAPLRLDLAQVLFFAHMFIGPNSRMYICRCTVMLGVTFEDGIA